MSKIEVYGASDDLIEISGDLEEEFYLLDDEKGDFLSFNDGTVLHIAYGIGGAYWKINRMKEGKANYSLKEATNEDDDYSDRVTLEGDISSVVHGKDFKSKKIKRLK